MNRLHFSLAAASSLAVLAGCDNNNKPARTATLLSNSQVQEALQRLESAIDTLEGNVGQFDSDNWREIVPEVETSATDVRDAFSNLQRALRTPES